MTNKEAYQYTVNNDLKEYLVKIIPVFLLGIMAVFIPDLKYRLPLITVLVGIFLINGILCAMSLAVTTKVYLSKSEKHIKNMEFIRRQAETHAEYAAKLKSIDIRHVAISEYQLKSSKYKTEYEAKMQRILREQQQHNL